MAQLEPSVKRLPAGWDQPGIAGGPDVRLKIATAVSGLEDACSTMDQLFEQLALVKSGVPDFVSIHYGSGRPAEAIWRHAMRGFGGTALHGGSSCFGVMSEKGAAIENGDSVGAFAIWDRQGAYGSALEPLGNDPRAAARLATREALRRAGRAGEAPDLVWLTAAPGHEELVLAGVKDLIGRTSLIVGASAADNEVAGGWTQFDSKGVATDAVVVSVLFPSVPLGCAFESGYAPTERRGRVTGAIGRSLTQIDGRPAAEVYEEWTGGKIVAPNEGSVSILSRATMFPLGRKAGDMNGIPFHMLLHPANGNADGALDLFATAPLGEDVCLMLGSEESLLQRAARIAATGRDRVGEAEVAGALIVYCGGCMLAVKDRMNEVAASISQALGGAPFLGVFSFGEQGAILGGETLHGNLMISATVFGRQTAAVDSYP